MLRIIKADQKIGRRKTMNYKHYNIRTHFTFAFVTYKMFTIIGKAERVY